MSRHFGGVARPSTTTQRCGYTVMFMSSLLGDTTGNALKPVNKLMGDPPKVAHAKKVRQEKHHKDKHAPKAGPASSQHAKNVQPDKKPAPVAESPAKSEVAKPTQ